MSDVIMISETMPGYFEIKSLLSPEQTANLLTSFAINAHRRTAVAKHEKEKEKAGSIINPHTGQTIPGNGERKKVKSRG